jgi:hypothetical protein
LAPKKAADLKRLLPYIPAEHLAAYPVSADDSSGEEEQEERIDLDPHAEKATDSDRDD